MQTTVDVDDGETVSFYWKVSSESGGDYLKFYIDDDYQNEIGGEIDWQKKVYTLSGAGEHTLKTGVRSRRTGVRGPYEISFAKFNGTVTLS